MHNVTANHDNSAAHWESADGRADATVALLPGRTHEGRNAYSYSLLLDGTSVCTGRDLHSGCWAAVDASDQIRALSSFLGAWAEALDYDGSENADLFPTTATPWLDYVEELGLDTYGEDD